MLGGSHLVVLCLGQYTQLPQLLIQLPHERGHAGLDGAVIVVVSAGSSVVSSAAGVVSVAAGSSGCAGSVLDAQAARPRTITSARSIAMIFFMVFPPE